MLPIFSNPAFNNPIGGYSIVFSVDQRYLRPAMTLMESIVAHSKEMYNFFILHEGISSFCQQVVERYARGLNVAVYFINLAERKIKGPVSNHYTEAMYYRLVIPQLFKKWERILYLDVDILALSDISLIFDVIEKEKAIAAVKDVFIASTYPGYAEMLLKSGKAENYFNSGVIVFNCQNISEEDISESLGKIGKYTVLPDQDILNYIYEGRVHYLSHEAHFLLLNGKECAWDIMQEEDRKEGEKVTHPILIHYAGGKKPWSADFQNNHDGYHYYDEYQKTKQRTDKN